MVIDKSTKARLTLKDLPLEERPREKMEIMGAAKLSTTELIAIMLRTGNRQHTAIQLAEKILSEVDSIRYLTELSLEELQGIKGIGLAKAVQVKAALELGRRIALEKKKEAPSFTNPEAVAAMVMEEMRYLDQEHLKVMLLNIKNKLISMETIFIGGLNSSIVHPREVFKVALKRSAASIIILHNHPSGDPSPSQEDINVTNRLLEAGKLLGIDVLDHLIIGEGKYISFKEKGLI